MTDEGDRVDDEQAGLFHLRELRETTSTNDEIKRAIEAGEPEGLAIGALRQTAGYGRQGRTWSSPVGGMYVSCLLRPHVPASQLPTLSLVAALSVRRIVAGLTSGQAKIAVKWPNDIVVALSARQDNASCQGDAASCTVQDASQNMTEDTAGYAKLCGISLEAHRGGICVGIGMNVFSPPEGADTPLVGDKRESISHEADERSGRGDADTPSIGDRTVAAYLDDIVCGNVSGSSDRCQSADSLSIASVRTAVLISFSEAYEMWLDLGFAPFLPEYEACAYLTGHQVSVEDVEGAPVIEGIVQGVDEQGRLLVTNSDTGKSSALVSGEVHLL